MPLTLRFDEFWEESDDEQSLHFDEFEDQYGPYVQTLVDAHIYNLWQEADLWDVLDSVFPADWNAAKRAAAVGVSRGQYSRYANRKGSPNPQTVFRWLRRFGVAYPPIPKDPIYDAIGIAAAVQRLVWETRSKARSQLRRQRMPVGEFSLAAASLLASLTSPGSLHENWLMLARPYQSDLSKAADDPSFERFLADLLGEVGTTFGKSAEKPYFAETANRLAEIDLDQKEQVLALLAELAGVWNTEPLLAHFVSRCWRDSLL